ESLKRILRELVRSRMGVAGLAMIFFFLTTSIYVAALVPIGEMNKWNRLDLWLDNPPSTPPRWVTIFAGKRIPETVVIESKGAEAVQLEGVSGVYSIESIIRYDFHYDDFPSSLILSISAKYHQRQPSIHVTWERPDGTRITLIDYVLPSPHGEPPYMFSGRFYLSTDSDVKMRLSSYIYEKTGLVEPIEEIIPEKILFSRIESKGSLEKCEPLKGLYRLRVSVRGFDERDSLDSVRLSIGGKAHGLMGTDSYRRDLLLGILWGTPIALLVGLLTATLSTLSGLTLGAVSGYYLGRVDEVIQRFTDFMMSIPALPILILLSFLLRPSIWNIILLLALFGWMGVCKVARSMAMQLREEAYVEAARSMGASNTWIILHHILPQLLPYMFAQAALTVPSAILSEAALSFLGLGDPTIVTWGKILHDAQIAGAAVNNYWWWVLTPGVLIALVALSFSLLGNALDRILQPKLRR
ncbi:MAG: ABC transporter permease, partial [Candidatus Bathyarchaeia archaeon]